MVQPVAGHAQPSHVKWTAVVIVMTLRCCHLAALLARCASHQTAGSDGTIELRVRWRDLGVAIVPLPGSLCQLHAVSHSHARRFKSPVVRAPAISAHWAQPVLATALDIELAQRLVVAALVTVLHSTPPSNLRSARRSRFASSDSSSQDAHACASLARASSLMRGSACQSSNDETSDCAATSTASRMLTTATLCTMHASRNLQGLRATVRRKLRESAKCPTQ